MYYAPDDSDDELLDEEPDLDTAMLNHAGGVNRIRVRLQFDYNSIVTKPNLKLRFERNQAEPNQISHLVFLGMAESYLEGWQKLSCF